MQKWILKQFMSAMWQPWNIGSHYEMYKKICLWRKFMKELLVDLMKNKPKSANETEIIDMIEGISMWLEENKYEDWKKSRANRNKTHVLGSCCKGFERSIIFQFE